MERYLSFTGLFVMLGLAWLMSSDRWRINWRVVVGGLLLQFGIAWLLIRPAASEQRSVAPLAFVGSLFTILLGHVDAATNVLFGEISRTPSLAFRVLPAIIFFSALMSLLFHLGMIQIVVQTLGWLMRKSLGTSGAESLSAAANIFLGQTEAPLVIKPYLAQMTDSEVMAVMVGGFATVAGGVMAAYISMGIDAGHLLTASIISAPASLLIAKILQPEISQPQTLGANPCQLARTSVNMFDAIAEGAAEGMKMALNVAAMLIAFLTLIAVADNLLATLGNWFGAKWTLALWLGYVFAPFARLMGVEAGDVRNVGELIGLRMATNEFLAYERLAEWSRPESPVHLSQRSQVIATYALCGFANLGSIGVQIGGLSTLAPLRRGDFARLGFRAMLGGTLVCFMTACIAGILI